MRGSCLCGAVAYEVDQLDMPITHCHCRTCRKANAAAFVTSAGVKREHFRWVHGLDVLAAFESSPGKFRRFCSVCGSHLVAERTAQSMPIMVRVATLDEDPGSRAAQHIWCSHDVPWLRDNHDVAFHDEWPPGR